MKVKILINDSRTSLEKEINNFIHCHNIIDIKYSITVRNNFVYSAMILYEGE